MNLRIERLAPLIILLPVLAYWPVSLGGNVIFGDEGFYAAMGRYMATTGDYPVWDPYISTAAYQQPNGRQPLYITLNSGLWLIGGELAIKLALPLLAALTGLALYLLLARTAGQVAGLAGGLILVSSAGFVTYGVLDYVEVFNTLLFVLAVLFASTGRTTKHWLLTGLFAGLAALTDITGVFVLPLLAVILAVRYRRDAIRPLLLVAAVALAITAPWLLRNVVLFSSPCIPPFGGCLSRTLTELPSTAYSFTSNVAQAGTGAGILSIGWLNYFGFAFGLSVFLLLLFGLAALPRARETWLFIVPWLLLFILLTVQQGVWGGRSEDVPRFTLFAFPAVAATGGLFVASAYKFLARWHVWLGVALIAVLLIVLWPGVSSKLATMQQVKAFAPGFLTGCEWVKANTQADALIFTIYQHHMTYACDRRGFSPTEVPDGAAIALSNNDTAWEHLRLHGTSYVMIAQFTISQQALGETVTPAFLNYLETSSHFKKVYDNTASFGTSGIILYEVL